MTAYPGHVRHRCGGPVHRVDLVVPAAFASMARELLEPFIPMAHSGGVSSADRAWWQVRTTIQAGESLPGYEPVDLAVDGEPTVRLSVHATKRDLVVDSSAPDRFVVAYLARYVRILLRLAHAQTNAELFLHAGMVAATGRGVALIGGKRAGKTSTILASMQAGREFVSNDDLSIVATDSGWEGRGWPRTVSIRPDSLAAIQVSVEAHSGVRSTGGNADRATLLVAPVQLAALLGAPPPTPHAQLAALVFPRFTDVSSSQATLMPLDAGEAASRLVANAQPVLMKQDTFLLAHFPLDENPRSLELASRIAADVPAYELVQHFSAVPEGAAAVFDLLTTPKH